VGVASFSGQLILLSSSWEGW